MSEQVALTVMDTELAQLDTVQWEAAKTRGDITIASDRTGVEPDDPDAVFSELYGCGSPRNYSRYCDDTLTRLIDQQSQELDQKKRDAMIHEVFKIHSDDVGHIPLHQQALAWGMKKSVDLVQLADNINQLKWVVVKTVDYYTEVLLGECLSKSASFVSQRFNRV